MRENRAREPQQRWQVPATPRSEPPDAAHRVLLRSDTGLSCPQNRSAARTDCRGISGGGGILVMAWGVSGKGRNRPHARSQGSLPGTRGESISPRFGFDKTGRLRPSLHPHLSAPLSPWCLSKHRIWQGNKQGLGNALFHRPQIRETKIRAVTPGAMKQ